ncbi:MAG: hypothetical protein DI553_00480 [Cutibacterium acnes]|nr:MAG: hypothetical protein DI553_00480 [Cutibacterium acnes]
MSIFSFLLHLLLLQLLLSQASTFFGAFCLRLFTFLEHFGEFFILCLDREHVILLFLSQCPLLLGL